MDDLYRQEQGLLWPAKDRDCAAVTFSQVADADRALVHVKSWGSCIQAGGNTGVWAGRLSGSFDAVYAFEPDPVNFRCLVHNTPLNVYCYQACLGNTCELVELYREPRNCGAHYVDESAAGSIPVLRIDDFGLYDCGLIVLDIEGWEHFALQGAHDTIARCKPVLMYEDKGLSDKFGYSKGDIEKVMSNYGYKVVDRVHRDVILAC